ncbi:hydroxymethylpyrimidine ABC transporter substrate-binding protein [Streptomyces sp. WM6373]|uniref:CE1759 family FMN reductase n=1 Tax=Streptomyces TaxID=1883 RepID=UPI0006B0536D|nr:MULTISPECIES: CE1759 family FMN reductase [unclassified Streptomyces]KOU35985.1 hydroxymethylpyrimidine ABC transporter substrate-binding protein [Streptomyces sp. WM6373]KOU93764.1 hydroxymethylpyrimidine ABC transporter substrate-binding protein [Streptomyces sp. XY58]KOV08030.1 hydroxymethylpyrimidine ABC transporter substrate-binding protein [Streptomyces sp. XY37]KOV27666.1 hydroxymethylpyrimidine ABC transporter substrate-binding protein [Streptomyces sp. XY413]KOV53437.1 hydroxymethy
MRIVVVSAGLSSPSSTRLLADRLTAATLEHVDAETEVVELRELATEIAQHFVTGFPPARLAAALDAVAAADGLIAVTPVFAGSYSGLFKSFFDLIDKDSLTGKPVLLGATGGTARHSLVTEHALRPLFTYLRALVLPTAVYAASEDWGEEGLAQRIARAGAELARFTTPAAVPGQGAAPDVDTAAAIAPRSLTGAITSVDPADGFVTVPFEQRLAALRVP